jgi:hypothetical protein
MARDYTLPDRADPGHSADPGHPAGLGYPPIWAAPPTWVTPPTNRKVPSRGSGYFLAPDLRSDRDERVAGSYP